jgi:hypothetical protein
VFAGLVSATHGYIFSCGSVFDDDFLGVSAPVKEGPVKEESVGTGTLARVGLTSEIDVCKTGEG